jgi:hypothetical protein
MAFTDGLDRWQLGGTFLRQGTGFDYSATTEDGRAILAAAVPEPAGFAFLAQEIEPDDYRGRTVTFRGELRTAQADGRAGLVLRVTSPGRPGHSSQPAQIPGKTRSTTSTSPREPARGPSMRSPPRSRRTPTSSRSASS